MDEGLLDHVRDAVVHAVPVREGGRIVDFEYVTVNAAAREVLGRDDLVGCRMLEVFAELAGSEMFDGFVEVVETGQPWTSSKQQFVLDGEERWFEGRADRHGDDELVMVFTDVTVRHELRRRAVRERRRAKRTLEAVSDAFYALDDRWRFTYVNRAAERLLDRDRDELLGRPSGEVFPEAIGSEFDRHLRQVFERRVPVSFEAHYPEPLDAWYSARVYPAADGGVVVFFRDVTQQRRTEARMRQLQRLEDLRSLAMAVAHDFNNLATVIHGSLELLREQLEDGWAEEDLSAIAEAARRSEKLARQLVEFGKAQQLSPRKQTANAVLERIRPLVERLVGADIHVTMHHAEPDVAFRADPDQLDRVLLNLASNARHAMPDGGQLTISAHVHQVAADPDGSELPAGDYVAFELSDTGVGMDEQTRQRAVEPLFTTKTEQVGVGLGLATAHAFATQTDGTLHIESTPDVGTTVTLLLPASTDRSAPAP